MIRQRKNAYPGYCEHYGETVSPGAGILVWDTHKAPYQLYHATCVPEKYLKKEEQPDAEQQISWDTLWNSYNTL
jgi:hypothetical protein